MSATPQTAAPDSLAPDSREDIKQRFLAACEKSRHGGPPPDIEVYLASVPEPERHDLRIELQAASKASAGTMEWAASDANAVPNSGPNPSQQTIDFAPSSTVVRASAEASPARTSDRAAVSPEGTLDYVAPSPGQTTDDVDRELSSDESPLPKSVAGHEIIRVLGRGAMGVVYKARQRGLKRIVALKMILAGAHATSQDLARFRSEAEAVAHLQHPNIVQIYEVGDEEGRPYFSLEYVDGASLDSKVRGTPLPPKDAARLMQQIAAAMEYAHAHGIIHRDLKPANVLLTADGVPKVTDFGLAKRLEDDSGHTRSGTVLGTPSYMPPEQAEGGASEAGPLADIYSMGAILYEMLTGRPPFRGSTVLETLEQVRTREPVAPTQLQPNIPRDLETIALKCLQKEAAKRYASAAVLGEDLSRYLAGEPIVARPVSRVERVWRWCRRNPRTAVLSAAVALLIVAWAVTSSILAWNLKQQRDETESARIQAQFNADEATKNAGIAERNEIVAKRNEQSAKDTADATVKQMIDLGETLLKSKRLSVQAPEVVRLLRQSLVVVSQKIDMAGATSFGQVGTSAALGDLLARLGQYREALILYKEGYDRAKAIADKDPNDDVAQGNFGVMALRLGESARDIDGDNRTARKRYTEARNRHVEILTHPRSQYYKDWDMKRLISHDDVHIGEALLALGQPAEARKYFEESLKYRQEWLAAAPKSPAPSWIMQSHLFLGIAAFRSGDAKAAREHFDEAVRRGEEFVQKSPNALHFKKDLAETQGALGDFLLAMGNAKEASASYQESFRNVQALIAGQPDVVENQVLHALTHERLGAVSRRLKQIAEADAFYREALKLRSELRQSDPSNLSHQVAHVLALAHAEKHGEAKEAAAKVPPHVTQSTELLLQLARAHALCAALEPAKKMLHVEKAMAALKAAVGDEYADTTTMVAEPDFDAIRAEPAFESLLGEIKKRAAAANSRE